MATDMNLYAVARATKPLQVEACLPDLQRLTVPLGLLNGRALREAVERSINRSLLWEEWLDVRRDWCNYYNAKPCDAVQGDPHGVERCGRIGQLRGYGYVLLEIV